MSRSLQPCSASRVLSFPEEISLRIAKDVKPVDCKAEVQVLYQSVEDRLERLPRIDRERGGVAGKRKVRGPPLTWS